MVLGFKRFYFLLTSNKYYISILINPIEIYFKVILHTDLTITFNLASSSCYIKVLPFDYILIDKVSTFTK